MRFFRLSVAGAITLGVLSRGVTFAFALKHDASKASSTTELVRKDTRVSKEKRIDDSFSVLNGHRSLEAVDPEWQTKATNLWETPGFWCRGFDRVSMSADGKTFAIGCREENQNSGRVKVYSVVGGEWETKGEDFVGETGQGLGQTVALSADGSVLAIGSLYGPETKKGCIKVYKFENNAWNPMGGQIDGENDLEQFGYEISLSADGTILAGSGDVNTSKNEGLVRVYRYASGLWDQLGDTFMGGFHTNELGYKASYALGQSTSLSESGKVIAIGSPGEPVMRVYEYVNDEWNQMGGTIHGATKFFNGYTATSNFGWSSQISADSSTIVVGVQAGDKPWDWTGWTEVYRFIEGQWTQIGQFLAVRNSQTGKKVSISADGNIIAIAAPAEGDKSQGVVRVYEYSGSGTQWNQLGGNIYGPPTEIHGEYFGQGAFLSANGYTLVAAGNTGGASVFKLPIVEEWDGVWFIDYDSVALSGDVLTSTYLTKPGVSEFTVSHTLGACNTNGASLVDSSVITNVDSLATVVDDEMSDTLSVAKTLNAAAIVDDHDGELNFCETVTLTNSGELGTETVDVVQAQAYYTVTASFLAEIGTYSSVTLVDESSITIVEQSLSLEGTIAVKRCADLTDSINPGDKLCLEIYVSDSQTVGVERIHNLDLKQGTSTFAAIDNGVNQYSALVEESCADGTCTVDIVVPDSLFTDESGASELTLSITGDAYLYEKEGAKDEDENESKAFSYSVQLEKPCTGGLRGFVENMLSL